MLEKARGLLCWGKTAGQAFATACTRAQSPFRAGMNTNRGSVQAVGGMSG